MTDTAGIRQTSVVAYRRYVIEQMIAAFRVVFNSSYSRERQFQDLKITPTYPLTKIDYPSLVISFDDRKIVNAGVGHVEWFLDQEGVLRQWGHRRFEGSLSLQIYALSPLDRDLLADGVIECLSFGRLDTHLGSFFTSIYGDPDNQPDLVFQQLMLNTDLIQGMGTNVAPAPWQPEDVLVYSIGYGLDLHGGIYNAVQDATYQYVTDVKVQSYAEDDVEIKLPFSDLDGSWTNPRIFEDGSAVKGKGVVSSSDTIL